MMEIVFESTSGKIIHDDNLNVLSEMDENSIDSCISDFPYAIEFMGKNWDSVKHWNQGTGVHGKFKGTGYGDKKRPEFHTNKQEDKPLFYNWCLQRAELLIKVMKPGGYVAIFGHPKTNHRMKCAFEDAGFKIVEEIDWIYSTGMPKNQDIGKLFDKQAGAKREVICTKTGHTGNAVKNHLGNFDDDSYEWPGTYDVTIPNTEMAKKFDDWKTAGLKPAHEPITIFQKPLEGTYIQNIEKYGCGAMNIGACRVPFQSETDIETAKAKTNFTEASDHSRGFGNGAEIYGTGNTPLEQAKQRIKDAGRFPPNVILDTYAAETLDDQTGISKSTGGSGRASRIGRVQTVYGDYSCSTNENYINESLGGYGDTGGGSRYFPIIKYCPKVSPSERKLPNGERNPHITVKPIELIKWLIKLITPIEGTTIDITAGSCTHAVACELLNTESNYKLNWIDIELMNTEKDPYCDVGKSRVENIIRNKQNSLF